MAVFGEYLPVTPTLGKVSFRAGVSPVGRDFRLWNKRRGWWRICASRLVAPGGADWLSPTSGRGAASTVASSGNPWPPR